MCGIKEKNGKEVSQDDLKQFVRLPTEEGLAGESQKASALRTQSWVIEGRGEEKTKVVW